MRVYILVALYRHLLAAFISTPDVPVDEVTMLKNQISNPDMMSTLEGEGGHGKADIVMEGA